MFECLIRRFSTQPRPIADCRPAEIQSERIAKAWRNGGGGDDNRNRTPHLRHLRQKHTHNQCRAYSIVETRSAKFKSSQGSRKKLPEVFLKPLGRFQKSPGLCRQRVDPLVRKGCTLLKEGGIPLCVKGVYPFEGRGYTPLRERGIPF